MLRLTFTEKDIEELHYQRYHHPHPGVQMKMEAVLLKAKGIPHHQIASCVGVCENTVRSYLKQYQTGGIEALKRLAFHHPTSELEAHHDTIEASFREHPATTIPQAAKLIEQLTGLKRLKTSAIPVKCDVDQQATFTKTNWSRDESRPRSVSAPSFSSMRPISSWEPTWGGDGVLPAWSYVRPAGGNASTCWAR